MQNDPTQSSTHPIGINHPKHKKEVTNNDDNKNTGLPRQDDEEIVEDESKPEDYVKFNVDKIDELKTANKESKDEK